MRGLFCPALLHGLISPSRCVSQPSRLRSSFSLIQYGRSFPSVSYCHERA